MLKIQQHKLITQESIFDSYCKKKNVKYYLNTNDTLKFMFGPDHSTYVH